MDMIREVLNTEKRLRFITRNEARELDTGIKVDAGDRRGELKELCPFYRNKEWRIPVPGTEMTSQTIEGVWQGLKIVNGKLDYGLFAEDARKRPRTRERKRDANYDYTDSRFMYVDEIVDLLTARMAIYVSAYKFVFDNYVGEEFKESISTHIEEGKEIVLYDWDDNKDILDDSDSYAHASLLRDLLRDHQLERKNIAKIETRYWAFTDPLNFREPKALRYADLLITLLKTQAKKEPTEELHYVGNYTGAILNGKYSTEIAITPEQDVLIMTEDRELLELAKRLKEIPFGSYRETDSPGQEFEPNYYLRYNDRDSIQIGRDRRMIITKGGKKTLVYEKTLEDDI